MTGLYPTLRPQLLPLTLLQTMLQLEVTRIRHALSCLQAFEHAVLSLDQFSPPSLSYLLLDFQIPDINRETCLLFDSFLFPYLTSSTFLRINISLIAINHYRLFLEASEEYMHDCHIVMSGILQQ